MAKKTEGRAPSARVAETMESFAEDLGKLLGTAQAKATSWLEQRKSIAEQLTQIRDTANDYLQRLSGEAASVGAAFSRGRRRGRPPRSGKKKVGRPGRPKGSGRRKGQMSAAGRAAVSAAQKKRWAKIRREKAKAGGEGGNG